MTARRPIILTVAALLLVALAWAAPMAAPALRLGFVVAGAAPIGAVLLLCIGRLTGADWQALAPLVRPLPLLVPAGVVAMLAEWAVPLPAHLAVWSHPLFVAARAGVAVAALAFAGWRLAGGASRTFAGVTLALYAALVTPVATDWLLGTVPGHPASAVGMMLCAIQIGAACAWMLVTGIGGERMRRDMSVLQIAAGIGLGYLAFMDYLIVWFGNLPTRVPFYIARSTPAMGALVVLALLLGTAAPIALAALGGDRNRRLAGACGLAALCLFALWWFGGAIATVLVGLIATIAIGLIVASRSHADG